MREEHDVPLASLTTMRVGGPAARLVVAETIDEVVDAVREVDDADEPLLVLGGGSNLVVADAGFPGTVVRVANDGIAVESADLCADVLDRGGTGRAGYAGQRLDPGPTLPHGPSDELVPHRAGADPHHARLRTGRRTRP